MEATRHDMNNSPSLVIKISSEKTLPRGVRDIAKTYYKWLSLQIQC